MTQKLFAHKSKTMRKLSILLSFLLLCNCVISSNVTTQAGSEVTAEATEISGTDGAASAETGTDATAEGTETAGTDTDDTLTESVSDGVILTGTYGDITVTVEAAEDAFTEEVSVNVSAAADEDAFEAAVLEACADIYPADTYTVIDVAAVNISFLTASGAEAEPSSEVKVTISGLDLATESTDEDETTHTANYALIFHMDDEGNMEWIDERQAGQGSYEFTASEFSDYGIATVEVTYTEEEEKEKPGTDPKPGEDDPGSGQSSQETDPSYYTKSAYVFYDTFTPSYNNEGTITGGSVNTAARDYIESVTLNSISVVQRNSSTTGWSTNGASTLETYFPDAYYTDGEHYNVQTVTLSITPKSGYYVTAVVVACTSNGSSTPYNCNTMEDANAFNTTFSVGTNGEVTVSVTSTDFSHGSRSPYYFILIAVSPIPSPLYVEYDYGNIVDIIGATGDSSAFSTATGWTATSDGNYYGNGYSDTNADITYTNGSYTGYGVMTDDTQYKYAYTTNSSTEAAEWTHYANSITDDAKAQAAAAGYVFAGWKADYYTSVTVAENSDKKTSGYQDDYNNWDYSFSSTYGETTYAEGDSVTLTTNVRLIAQWVPIGVKITKSVTGTSGTEIEGNHTYTFQLYSSTDGGSTWTAYGDPFTLTVNGDGEAYTYIYPLPAGTYKIVETDPEDGSTTTANSITYTLTVSEDGTVTWSYSSYSYTEETVTDSEGTTTVYVLSETLDVTNTYSPTTSVTVTKVWEDTGYEAYRPTEVTVYLLAGSDVYTVNGVEQSSTLNSGNSWTYTWSDLPTTDSNGDAISWNVSEVSVSGYTSAVSGSATSGYTITNTLEKGTLTVSKTVSGNMGDTTKDFSFTLTVTAGNGTAYTGGLSYTKTASDGTTTEGTLTVTDGTWTFTLQDGEEISFVIPSGYTYTVTESNYKSSDGYTSITVSTDGGTAVETLTATGTVSASGTTVAYTNTKEVIPDTGIALDSAPYILMLAGVFALGGLMLNRRRRRRW